MNRRFKQICISVLSWFSVVVLTAQGSAVYAQKADDNEQSLAERLGTSKGGTAPTDDALPYYSEIKQRYLYDAIPCPLNVRVEKMGGEYTSFEGKHPDMAEDGAGIITDENTKSLTWTVQVPQTGLYHIEITYKTYSDSAEAPKRELLVNGEQTFYEQSVMVFERKWQDAHYPNINALGDHVRPPQTEIVEFSTKTLSDQWSKDCEPLLFLFDEGDNTITLRYINQPLIIARIAVVSYKEVKPYSEVLASYDLPYGTDTVRLEAEDKKYVAYRSDVTVSIGSSGDPVATPFSAANIRLNMIGGTSFSKGGQEICWEFEVPRTGLYKINLRTLQSFTDGLPSYRTVYINGEVPFREMQNFEFPYRKRWFSTVLSDENGSPYLFRLNKGKNTLLLKVTLGGITAVVEELLDATKMLSKLILDITMVTGHNPDINYDYELDTEIPDMIFRLSEIRDMIDSGCKSIRELSQKNSAVANNLERIAKEIDELIEKPSNIPLRLSDIKENLSSLSTYSKTIQEMPLGLDYIEILPYDAVVSDLKSSFFQKVWVTILNFLASFEKDYNAVSTSAGSASGEPLDVWVVRGKEWGQMLKEMADDSFFKQTGSPVKMNILPSGTVTTAVNPLLLAIGAGKAPDVVLGLTYNMAVEYAMRNALVDLSSLDDYEEISKRFLPEMMVPYTFENGIYALPETMSFRALYYRSDIFEKLGLKAPDTWDEVYNKLLPALSQNNMTMYVPPLLDIFLYQLGGEYYTKDGLRSGLDTPEAFAAFAELCRLYTDNGLPISTDFYSRFRTGEMPVGIENHNAYLQFSYASPEISGNWKIAPVPGHRRADGTVDRTNSGLSIDCAVILKGSELEDIAWEFLKWWTSTEIQTSYALRVEGQLGPQARWMSSNTKSYWALPWDIDEKNAILSAWEWAKETPVVRGGYYTNRHLVNAINRAVVENISPRTALEEAVEQINKELVRKQIMLK